MSSATAMAGFGRRWRLLAAALAWLALPGCSPPERTPAPPGPPPAVLPAGAGTLYLLSGPRHGRGDLYRLAAGRAAPERLTHLVPGRDITGVTAGSGQVVVNASLDFLGKVYRVAGRRLEPLTRERGFSPVLSDDGRLAYESLTYDSPGDQAPSSHNVVVRELGSGREHVAYSTPLPFGGLAWGPGGRLAVAVFTADYKAHQDYVIVGPDGSQHHVAPVAPLVYPLTWSRSGLMALGVDGGPSVLLDVDSGRRQDLAAGWRPLCWSPDGSTLLVNNGRRLGLLRPPEVARVEELGTFGPGPVWDAAWSS